MIRDFAELCNLRMNEASTKLMVVKIFQCILTAHRYWKLRN